MDVCEMFAKRLGNVALIVEVWKASCPSLDLWIFPRVAAQAADGWPISLFLSLSLRRGSSLLCSPLAAERRKERTQEGRGKGPDRSKAQPRCPVSEPRSGPVTSKAPPIFLFHPVEEAGTNGRFLSGCRGSRSPRASARNSRVLQACLGRVRILSCSDHRWNAPTVHLVAGFFARPNDKQPGETRREKSRPSRTN